MRIFTLVDFKPTDKQKGNRNAYSAYSSRVISCLMHCKSTIALAKLFRAGVEAVPFLQFVGRLEKTLQPPHRWD